MQSLLVVLRLNSHLIIRSPTLTDQAAVVDDKIVNVWQLSQTDIADKTRNVTCIAVLIKNLKVRCQCSDPRWMKKTLQHRGSQQRKIGRAARGRQTVSFLVRASEIDFCGNLVYYQNFMGVCVWGGGHGWCMGRGTWMVYGVEEGVLSEMFAVG